MAFAITKKPATVCSWLAAEFMVYFLLWCIVLIFTVFRYASGVLVPDHAAASAAVPSKNRREYSHGSISCFYQLQTYKAGPEDFPAAQEISGILSSACIESDSKTQKMFPRYGWTSYQHWPGHWYRACTGEKWLPDRRLLWGICDFQMGVSVLVLISWKYGINFYLF